MQKPAAHNVGPPKAVTSKSARAPHDDPPLCLGSAPAMSLADHQSVASGI